MPHQQDKTHLSDLHLSKGKSYRINGQYKEAMEELRKAIQSNPLSDEAYNQLGVLFQISQSYDEAISCYLKALSLNKERFDILHRIGLAYQDGGQPQKAVEVYEKALVLDPGSITIHINMGTAYQMMNQYHEAIQCYGEAIRQDPGNPAAHLNMGTAYAKLAQIEKAVRCYETALTLKPDYEKAVCFLYKHYQANCNWEKTEHLGKRLDDLTQQSLSCGKKPEETPFLNISRHEDPVLNHAVAAAWVNNPANQPDWKVKGARLIQEIQEVNDKLNIGYLTNNFRNHPTAQLLTGLFRHHDATRFNIHCYSYGPNDDDQYRKTIDANCFKFTDLQRVSDLEAAKIIADDKIHILVDLNGHTTGSRLGICGLRPAPLQVRYLGFAGTTGGDFFDYLITDRIVTPEHDRKFYSESFIYMPACYQINDYAADHCSSTEMGSDDKKESKDFIFCSFSSSYKIDPILFDIWMRLLKQVDSSELWLLGGNPAVEHNLMKVIRFAGVDPDRIMFCKKLPKPDHIERLKGADVALDTRIVNGAITTSDALWAGLPVISIRGSHFASRMSASMLHAAGVPELVTESLEEYFELAIRLATSPASLADVKQKIATNKAEYPLFNTRESTKIIEGAYLKVWEYYQNNERIEIVKPQSCA
ncbi:MAG: tetratricopeptide repeat protein [Desulfobacteraceae bacterium]|nr:tetratricopeptide repeat protein [Desulfobacteraceae bacterium]